MRNQGKKIAVIFVEGDTEKIFYHTLINFLKERLHINKFICEFKTINIKGVGRSEKKMIDIFNKRIKKDYPNYKYHVFLCIDTDVFEFSKKPPVNLQNIKGKLKQSGVDHFTVIEAKSCIEDWLLYDESGIRRYLKLPYRKRNEKKSKGLRGLEDLYKKADKVYAKGNGSKELIESLNYEIITKNICKDIKELCATLFGICDNYCIKNSK